MKKLIKRIIFAVMSFTLCFAFTGCNEETIPPVNSGEVGGNWLDNMHREENDFLQDDNIRPSREPFVDNTPEDTGDPMAYRFEAEAAKIRGTTNGEDHFCTAKSTEFSPDFSGNITLCNLGTATLSFTFNSDKAVRSVILIRMANQYGSSTGGMLSAYANMTVNDKPVVDLSASFDIESGEVASGCSSSYFKMVTLETKVSLAEGKNVLSITPATANYLNLDYIEIHTSAVLEDKTESTVTNPSSFVDIAKEPTETATGQIGFVCHNKKENGNEVACKNDNARKRTLPELTNEIYNFKEFANGTQYVVEMYGGEAVIVSTVTYTLTLNGATFADGTTSGRVAPGERPVIKYTAPEGQVFSHWEDAEGNNLGSAFVMPEKDITVKPVFVSTENSVTVTLQGAVIDGKNTVTALAGNSIDLSAAEFENQPEGTVVRYWYNIADVTEYYENFKEFTVPDADITLAPAFDKAVYANRDGSTMGKLAIFPYYGYAELDANASSQPKDGYIRALESSGVKGRNAYWGYVGTGDNREMGAIYHWKGKEGAALANGFYFTPLSPYKVVSSTKYTIATTIQNQGDEEITLKLYQINGGSAPKTGVVSEEFTLQPGEVKTVSLAFSYNNGNIMTTVELLTDGITDLHIGMYQYIATALYNLTLDGATFADDSTTGTVAPGTSPELKYTVPDGKVFSHWEDADGNNLGKTFTMPEKDITIKPVFVTANALTVTLQGATLNGETTVETAAGRNLDLSDAVITNMPEGKILKGWCDVNDRTKIYSVSFNMPEVEALTLAPVFESEKAFYSDKTNYDGKIASTGNVFKGKEKGCYAVTENKTTGAINSGNGYYEFGNIYHFKGGTDAAPEDKMEVDSYFLTQEMNGWHSNVSNLSNHTVTITVENFGSEDITLRFALITSSGNPNSQYGEKIVTIKAGESVTFTFDVTYLHGSFMTNVMVKDHAVGEVHIGMYQYISVAE